MKEIVLCAGCPVGGELHRRVNGFLAQEENDYIRSGDVLLDNFLIPAAENGELGRERYSRISRNVSLAIIYLAQIEEAVNYANSVTCSQVTSEQDCPRLNTAISLVRVVRKAMHEDIKNPGGSDL